MGYISLCRTGAPRYIHPCVYVIHLPVEGVEGHSSCLPQVTLGSVRTWAVPHWFHPVWSFILWKPKERRISLKTEFGLWLNASKEMLVTDFGKTKSVRNRSSGMPDVRQLWGVPSLRKLMPQDFLARPWSLPAVGALALILAGEWERPRWEWGGGSWAY